MIAVHSNKFLRASCLLFIPGGPVPAETRSLPFGAIRVYPLHL